MFEIKLTARLKTVADNVYPLAAPLNYKSPAVIYNPVNVEPTRNINDDLENSAFMDFQIDVYSTSFLEAKTLARTIRNNLKAWQDTDVQAVAYLDEKGSVDNTTQTQLFRVMTFYKFFVTD